MKSRHSQRGFNLLLLLIVPLILFIAFVSFNWIRAQIINKSTYQTQPINTNLANCSNQKSNPQKIANLPYQSVNGEEQYVDVFIPSGTCLPAILLIHGGGFIAGDKKDFEIVAQKLMEKGFVVVNANYTLTKQYEPNTMYPAAVKDLQNVVTLLRKSANNFNIDPQKIAAMGGSSGGNLALMLGTTGKEGENKVQAVISWSGPLNFQLMDEKKSAEKNGNRINAITQYVGCSYQSCPEKWKDASPALHIDETTAPTLLVNSISEGDKPMGMPVSQLEDAEERLRKAGVDYIAKKVPGVAHAFFPQLLEETVEFLKYNLQW